jgi:hypothetical protein
LGEEDDCMFWVTLEKVVVTYRLNSYRNSFIRMNVRPDTSGRAYASPECDRYSGFSELTKPIDGIRYVA